MKKLLVVLLVAGASLFVARKMHLLSYASTVVCQVQNETKRAIPTKFELERLRQEIGSLDQDITQMVRPVAEYKVQIERMRKDVQKAQTNLEDQRKLILGMTEDLRESPKCVNYGGRDYPAEQVRQKLNKDFDGFKRLEAHTKTQRKLLDAKEASLKASQEQLAKVISKKREYELRLAQLEAEEETLQVARIGNKLQIDDSRATQIEATLSALENRHDVERNEIELHANGILGDNIPVHQRGPVDVQAIRSYLQGETPVEETAHK